MTKYMVLAGSSVPSCRMLKSEFYRCSRILAPQNPKFFLVGAQGARPRYARRPSRWLGQKSVENKCADSRLCVSSMKSAQNPKATEDSPLAFFSRRCPSLTVGGFLKYTSN